MKFPLKITNGIYLVNAFIKDKEANWVYRIEGHTNSPDINDDVIKNNRINLINNLRANMSSNYLNEIEEQGISLHYTYLNDAGDILYELRFTAEDLR